MHCILDIQRALFFHLAALLKNSTAPIREGDCRKPRINEGRRTQITPYAHHETIE